MVCVKRSWWPSCVSKRTETTRPLQPVVHGLSHRDAILLQDMGLHPLALLASATTAGMRRGGGEDGGVAAVPGLSLASRKLFCTSGLRGAHVDS